MARVEIDALASEFRAASSERARPGRVVTELYARNSSRRKVATIGLAPVHEREKVNPGLVWTIMSFRANRP